MRVTNEGRVGYGTAQDGVEEAVRLARELAQVVADGYPRFAEAVAQGNVYTIAPTAGVAPGTAIGTTAGLALWNPPGSAVVLALLDVTYAWASGTLGAGKLWHVLHGWTAGTPGGTQVTPVNHLGGAARGSKAMGYSTATGLGTAQALRVAGTVTALAADPGTGAVPTDLLEGRIVVPPGFAYSPQAVGAAGTTPTVFFSITYQEIAA